MGGAGGDAQPSIAENEIIVELEDGNEIINGYESSQVFAVLKFVNMITIDESKICNRTR